MTLQELYRQLIHVNTCEDARSIMHSSFVHVNDISEKNRLAGAMAYLSLVNNITTFKTNLNELFFNNFKDAIQMAQSQVK